MDSTTIIKRTIQQLGHIAPFSYDLIISNKRVKSNYWNDYFMDQSFYTVSSSFITSSNHPQIEIFFLNINFLFFYKTLEAPIDF